MGRDNNVYVYVVVSDANLPGIFNSALSAGNGLILVYGIYDAQIYIYRTQHIHIKCIKYSMSFDVQTVAQISFHRQGFSENLFRSLCVPVCFFYLTGSV